MQRSWWQVRLVLRSSGGGGGTFVLKEGCSCACVVVLPETDRQRLGTLFAVGQPPHVQHQLAFECAASLRHALILSLPVAVCCCVACLLFNRCHRGVH